MANDTNWRISDSRKNLNRNPVQRVEKNRKKAENKPYRMSPQNRNLFLKLIGLFCILIILLFFQSHIVRLNEDVRTLQSELDTINAEIDSKNGRLISNTDLKTIEAQARSYGMTEAQPNQYVYETAAKKQKNISNNNVGLYDYISFFVQIRSEGLWPQVQ